MYNLNNYEKALRSFGIQVEYICAMELGGSLTTEEAFKRIKKEYKKLKDFRKSETI